MTESKPEAWLSGAVAGIPPMLQPVAHGLLQCQEEVHHLLSSLGDAQLAARPGGAASIGYHVRHAVGSLDRLFTYARGEQLSEAQRVALSREKGAESPGALEVAAMFDAAVSRALEQLRGTDESSLLEAREVGRQRLPSTVLGLLFHAAEHTQRHIGQGITTAKIIRGSGA
jgi:uncharacterized damage-inducible protein DinB